MSGNNRNNNKSINSGASPVSDTLTICQAACLTYPCAINTSRGQLITISETIMAKHPTGTCMHCYKMGS